MHKPRNSKVLTLLSIIGWSLYFPMAAAGVANEEGQTTKKAQEQLLSLTGALHAYVITHANFPDRLDQVQDVLGKDRFGKAMHNPRTGDLPGYAYVKPTAELMEAAGAEGLVVLYELKAGKRDPAGSVARFVGTLKNGGAKAAPCYRLTDLGRVGQYGNVFGINNHGDAVGTIDELKFNPEFRTNQSERRAFLYSKGQFVDLHSRFGYAQSDARDINDDGTIVGIIHRPRSGAGEPFIYSKGKVKPGGSLGGTVGGLFAINNKGIAVGVSLTKNQDRHAIALDTNAQDLKPVDLGVLPGSDDSSARAINNMGLIGGGGPGEQDSASHCLLWEDRRIQVLSIFGPREVVSHKFIRDINDNNVMVGAWVRGDDGLKYRAFIWSKEWGRIDPPAGGGTLGGAHDINNFNLVVRHSPAFIWSKERGLVNLQDMLPEKSDWVLHQAQAINEVGQIVGTGTIKKDETPRGYLMTMFELDRK